MIARPWTDDLPKCKSTSVASYFSRLGGGSYANSNDDYLCFYCQTEENCLYGLFEPHNGLEAAKFIMQKMAAEILFPPPTSNNSDEEIRERLRNAFSAVENAYTEIHDGMIAERTSLQDQLPPMSESQRNTNNPIIARLKEIDQHLSAGATVVVALVVNNKLFVANVGECRALLCRTDDNSVLRVVQLTADHSVNNEDELLRLMQLGVDVDKLKHGQYLGNQPGTRCLGNYLVKRLHKAFPLLSAAAAEPVIAAAEAHGPVALDHYSRFLVLVSAGVYKRIQDSRGSSEQTNKQLAQIIVEHFRNTTDFQSVSQTVLQRIEEEFVSFCVKNNLAPKPNTHMSLLIRNFNFPLPNDQGPSVVAAKNTSVRFNPIVHSKTNTLLNEIDSDLSTETNEGTDSIVDTNRSIADTNRSIDSNSDIYPSRLQDRDKKIKGYVDFSPYYENVAAARRNGTLPNFIE